VQVQLGAGGTGQGVFSIEKKLCSMLNLDIEVGWLRRSNVPAASLTHLN
jgi:hypothetical protein